MRVPLFIFLFLLPNMLPAGSPNELTAFDGEVLEYSLNFRGLNSARSVLSALSNDSTFDARWDVDTKSVYSLLFKVHNTYRSRFDLQEGRLIFFEKEIDQKNIVQQFRIDYLWPQNMAVGNFGHSWEVPVGTVDILTMLYRLRLIGEFQPGDTLFAVDVESRLCRVKVDSVAVPPADGKFPVSEFVRLKLEPAGVVKKRAWKTDLLTNRIARPGSALDIWFGPGPQRLPVRLCFRSRESALVMELESVRSGGTRE